MRQDDAIAVIASRAARALDRGATLHDGRDEYAGSSGPSTVLASSQALGLIPMIDRTVAAVATRSRQELMPLRA